MLRLRTLLTRSLPPALCALAVAACGGSHHSATSTTTAAGPGTGLGTSTGSGTRTGAQARVADTHTLYIYSSLPLQGPRRAESEQIEQGINFVLDGADHRVGSYQIRYRALSDSAPPPAKRRAKRTVTASPERSALRTVQNAEQAARNPQTVAYIGDLASSATELSLPILNQAGIAQLTPGSGDPGLTAKISGGTATLFRLVPNDLVQAEAVVYWLKHDVYGCHTAAAAAFGGEAESTELVDAIQKDAKAYKLGFVSIPPPASAKDYDTYGQALQHGPVVNCFVLTGHVTRAAVAFTNWLALKLPAGSVIVGTNGLCNPAWTDHARGGVAAKVDPSLYCMSPVLPLAYYPGGRRFSVNFRKADHRAATAYTYYGYLAASLVLQAIRQIGPLDPRRTVLTNLTGNIASTDLDVYTFQTNGDLSGDPSADYYRLERVVNGIPKLYKVVKP